MNSASGRFQPRSRPLYPKICTTQYLSKILKDYRLKYSNKCNINLLRHSSSRRGWRDLASAAATHLLPAMPYGCSVTVDSACNATSFVQGKLTLQAGTRSMVYKKHLKIEHMLSLVCVSYFLIVKFKKAYRVFLIRCFL